MVGSFGQDKKTWAQTFINKGMEAFEEIVSKSRGKYCVGDQVTFADCCIIPQVFACGRFDVDVNKFKNIKQIVDNLNELPEFKAAHAN